MAPASKYQRMSLKDLIAERDEINAAIQEKQATEREAFRAEMSEKAAQLGLDLSELFGGKKRGADNGAARTPVAVKYRNPKDPTETWSGRGRPAGWIMRETDGDKKKFDKFLVK